MMCFKKTDGFSAPELLMVVAIIGIMAAVAIPSFISGIPRRQLKSAARDLYGAVQQARILAVKNSQNYNLIFEVKLEDGELKEFYYLDEDNDKSYDASAEVFTDKDDDGTYDIGEPFIDSDGSGSYSYAERRTDLSNYHDVEYGRGTAPTNLVGANNSSIVSIGSSIIITFIPAGTAEFSPDPVSGDNTVYLQNINNPSESVAVSVQLSGASKISWYTGNGTWE
jgi:prepilin-type N-terminal cleavage/methylation domain-containing protein